MQAEASPKKRPVSHPYLYRKRGFLYYRYSIPKKFFADSKPRELRISLRTNYLVQAQSLVSYLHAYTLKCLGEWAVNDDNAIESQEERIAKLRADLKSRVDNIIYSPNKKPVNIDEARKRLNEHLKNELDKDELEPMPVATKTGPDGKTKRMDLSIFLDESAKEIAFEASTFENFDDWFPVSILEMVNEGIFKENEISENNAILLAKLYHQGKAIFDGIKAARMRGDFAYEKSFFPIVELKNADSLSMFNGKSREKTSKKELKISELIDKYCDTQIKDGAWETRSLQDHKGRVSNLLDILGNKEVNKITREDMRSCRDILEQLPPSRTKIKKYKGLTVKQIIELRPEKTLSVSTVNVIIQAISSMFEWAIREELMSGNPAKGLTKKDETPDIEKRECFTNEEIKLLFYSDDYTQDKFRNLAHYWVPLIGLYTGMRLEEICQLHCEDVYQEEGIWLFDVTEESNDGLNDKKLKTKNAKRKIPIHDELISLGLIEYKNKISQNNKRLFPQLHTTEKTLKYGKYITKFFSNLLIKKGLKEGKSFHSLRHTFANFYKVNLLQNDVFKQVFGHSINDLAGKQYGGRFSPKQCYDEIISKLTYK